MKTLFILLILSLSYGQLCSSFSYDEAGCIGSIGHACRYNQYTNMCLDQSSSQVGCGSTLNIKGCLMQQTNPDGTLASCIFSGYCGSLYSILTSCQTNLNAGACLSVQGSYCLWNGTCIAIDSTYATELALSNSTSVLENASVSICTQMTIAAVHAQGIQVGLQTLYSASPTTAYKSLMAIPGCLSLDSKYIQYLTCTSIGLTKLACIQITNGKCIFNNGVCQDVKDFTALRCSQPLNAGACLGVTNNLQQCQWTTSGCTTFQVTTSTPCSQFTNPVSPSVCQAITTTTCYYNSASYGCDQQCSGNTQEAVCKQSSFNCVWSQSVCLFNLKDQCAILGSNSLACMNSPQYCQMINGICSQIVSMNLASCQLSGVYLNKVACVNTQNPTQLCQYTTSCAPVKLSPQTRCETLSMVNYYVCQRVTSEGCYYDTASSSCFTTSGNETCTTKGLNKLGCLQTTNTISPCQWDPASGSCGNINITSSTQCTSLKLVNRIACQTVSYGTDKCLYDSVNYGCILLSATNINCDATLGLNKQSCINLAPPSSTTNSWACRWLSGQCTQVSSLGSAISCSSLQYVTKHTCELVTQTQTCFYDPSRNSCSTSINPSDITGCIDKGYNPTACAFVPGTYSCYYDLVNKQCAVATATQLSSISCITNYPNQKACTAITTTGQYCLWSSISSLCTTQVFPTSQSCTSFTNVNPNLCLAFYQNAVQIINSTSYCTYTGTSCTQYTSASTWADCGSSNKVNLHACVAYSSPSTQCFFDQTALQCTTVQPTTLSTISCIQANKASCPQVTTAYQRCQWFSFTDTITSGLYTQNKCYHLSNVTGNCATYTNVSQYVCSAASPTTNEGCMWSSNNCVVTTNFNVPCSTAGLNKYACISSTNQACYYDSTNYACIQVTSTNSNQINCSSAVNQLGCLASTGAACKWSSNACTAVTVSATNACLDFSTGDKVNAIVCASVTLSGEYCIYSAGYCGSDSNVNDCTTGYNESNCLEDLGCQFQQNVCSSRPSGPDNNCSKAANQNDCLAVTSSPCAWAAGKCQFVNVNSKATCTSVSATNPSWIYNATTCSKITDTNSQCQYQSTGTPITSASCIAITPPVPCNQPGLNKYGCLMGTGNVMCYFNDQPGSNSCTSISIIGNTGCQSQLNIKACVSVTSAICKFDKILKTCSGVSPDTITSPCSSYTDASQAVYNSLFCRNVSSGACYYDPVNFTCVAAASNFSLNNCDTDASINSVLCQNQVILQVCQFNSSCSQSTQDLTKLTCSDSHAQYYRACTYAAGGQACKYTTNCSQVNVNVDCQTLTNINKQACMKNNFNNQPCQFVDSGLTTSCRYTPDTLQPCSGLNQISCVQNTANPCFFNNNICYDITATSNTAQCTTGFFFTQSACKQISTPGQACKWDGTNCVAYVIKSTDQCTNFSNPAVPTPSSVLYGEQICAQITTGACYWTAVTGCTNINISSVTCVVPITKGMNSLACIQAIGNCVFTNYQCLNASIPTNTTSSQCSDPSNQGGCTHLNNGQACQWNTNTSTCTSITSFSSCSSYTNVSPSTCSQTTDQPCYWVNGTCTILTSTGQSCLTYGLNQKACINYTTGLCYHNGKNCVTLQPSDLSKMLCTDLINQAACTSLSGQCCFWDGTKCQDESKSFTSCSMTNYSQFCCSKVVGQKCQYSGSCQVIPAVGSVSSCNTGYNQEACIAISISCYWNNNVCSDSTQTNIGCSLNLSQTACTSQTTFCMFTTYCQTGLLTSCANLLNTTNNSYCSQVTDVGCQSSGQKSCILSSSSTPCTAQNLNQIGCLNNINTCQWESNSCKQIGGPAISGFSECPASGYSRGICQQFAYCIFNGSNGCTTITITSTTACTDINNSKIGTECTQISLGKCQFDQVNQRCTTTITGNVCASYVNSLGCKYIQNNCVWSNSSCVTSTSSYYTCSQIYTQYWCIRNPYTSCLWSNDSCISYSGTFAACATYTSKPISPGICYYFSTDRCSFAIDASSNTYCVSDPLSVTCAGAKSPLGCQQVTPSGTCFWDQTTNLCQTIVPSTQTMLTCPQLQYTTQTLCLQTVSEGQTCYWNTSLNQCLSSDAYIALCTDLLSQKACVAVSTRGQQCKFTSSCAVSSPSTDLCEDFINLYACVAITKNGQQCQWMGQSCLKITTDYDFSAVLVNQNYCTMLTESNFKFSTINFTCAISSPLEDSCSTPGLNKLGCLQVQKFGCTWSTSLNQCQSFTDPGTYTLCSEYTNISPNVCSQITIQGQNCRYNKDTHSCEKSGGDICSTSGLNKAACLQVTQQACQWIGQCTTIDVFAGIQDCTKFIVPVNAMACAAVDINNQNCKYNGQGGCTTAFDIGFDSCTTPGLNRYGCVQVTIQNSSCQFANGFCQNYVGNLNYCNQLSNVNANVCKSLNTTGQPCKFSLVQRGCVSADSTDKCSQLGINKAGCQLSNQSCVWFDEIYKCTCSGMLSTLGMINCSQAIQGNCTGTCKWNNNQCNLALCKDISNDKCNGTILNTQYCYLQGGICQAAYSCNDIFSIDCSIYTVAGVKCTADANNFGHCTKSGCSQYSVSDCAGQCLWQGSTCTDRSCQYLSQTTCTGYYGGQQCVWYNGVCIGVTSCQNFELNISASYTAAQIESACKTQTVLGRQCYYQQESAFSSNYQCSSSLCSLRGESQQNCFGAETSLGEVCVLLPNFTCAACEEISDPCLCLSFTGTCDYSSASGCFGKPCSSFGTTQCQNSRCQIYSSSCKVSCGKLKESECATRSNDCHWDSGLSHCSDGQEEVVTINTLKDTVTVISFGYLISILLIY